MRPTSAPQPPCTGQICSAAQPFGVMFDPAQEALPLPYEIAPVAAIVACWPLASVIPVARNGVVAATESVFAVALANEELESRRVAAPATARIVRYQRGLRTRGL